MEKTYRTLTVGALIVGSGAAALSAALALQSSRNRNPENSPSVLLVTEGMTMGTSRNTGSDKQTYYKLATGMNTRDCARDMAEDYFACGSMHGDLALTEAAGSLRGFFRLVSLGVPFPCDCYGEYTGYKTDHDPHSRATSCGPLTSKYMTEALEAACRREGVPMLDACRVIRVLTKNGSAAGVICLCRDEITPENPAGLLVILCGALVWATGGPSAVYCGSVYPESQNCSLGAPLLAGASGVNLTESQYGIASAGFRWNLSGSYQQVIPRYLSVDDGGTEREFLTDTFTGQALTHAVFSKGYEWPFDPDKLTKGSRSSAVDLAVYREIQAGRRVFLDFRENPSVIGDAGITPQSVGQTAYDYLSDSGALQSTPIRRLRAMNEKAYQLYLSHGVDLEKERLEIAVCAQHLNGGLSCGIWYESPTLGNFFPVGECGGVFGVKRPGGSALNSTQVGSLRAADCIRARNLPAPSPDDLGEMADQLAETEAFAALLSPPPDGMTAEQILAERKIGQKQHDRCAAFLRDEKSISELLRETGRQIETYSDTHRAADFPALVELAISYDVLLTRYAMLSSMQAYIADGGKSRGSYLILENGAVPASVETDTAHRSQVLTVSLITKEAGIRASCAFEPVRPIPETDNWFETVYNQYGKPEFYETKSR